MNTLASQIDLQNIDNVYFIGIGGIGMSALARYFHAKGKNVAGYDRTFTMLTRSLEEEGIEVHYHDLKEDILVPYWSEKTTLVVVTPAVPSDLLELRYFQHNGFRIVKRAELLGLISGDTASLCVAGTHGKTTTSALLAHILQQTDEKCTAFIGGIASNYKTNVLISPDSPYTVIEADEFDRSFVQLSPSAAIVTSVDPDHLDIYSDSHKFADGFQQFADLIPEEGIAVIKYGLALGSTCPQVSYGSPQADYFAQDVRIEQGSYLFDVVTPHAVWKDIRLGIGGRHNIDNALACIALCDFLNIPQSIICQGLATFLGVKRRFEVVVNKEKLVYIDDYAHHPTELHALIESVRELYPKQRITAVFQPHLFSRTRDFFDNFVEELSRLDELVLMPIYPARERAIDGITSEILLEKINVECKRILDHRGVIDYLSTKKEGVFLTIGAGDIDRVVEPLKQLWNEA